MRLVCPRTWVPELLWLLSMTSAVDGVPDSGLTREVMGAEVEGARKSAMGAMEMGDDGWAFQEAEHQF